MIMSNSSSCVVVPARYASSRYPGKPLVPLLGKPMVLWVAERSAEAVGRENVYVATDDERIAEIVSEAGFSTLMTSSGALTGTDRLAEASQLVDYDIYINVQGDEPMVNPNDIRRCIEMKAKHPDRIINGYCWVGVDEDPANINLPKVITNEQDDLIYMSRVALPAFKDRANAPKRYKKQVCIYGFSRNELLAFANFGRKSELEAAEDIEILRFFELGYTVHMIECQPGLAVDVPDDVQRVEAAMQRQ
jgi:3-deoxy-manno-octulosonate cytidylyltransferase (CMP-KDO synthetase)